MIKYVIIITLITMLTSCEGMDYKLKIKNSLPCNVYVINYDTNSLNDYPNEILNRESDLILKDSTQKMGSFGSPVNEAWENRIKSARNKRLNLFVIAEDTIKAYSKEYIIKNKIYLRQLSYTLQEVEKRKWLIEIE